MAHLSESDWNKLPPSVRERCTVSKSVGEKMQAEREEETKKQPKYQKRHTDDPYKSDAEREYAKLLDASRDIKFADGTPHPDSVVRWLYEGMAFRLPDWGVYWPDFMIELFNGRIEFREIKGRGKYAVRDKAKAKFLDARRLFPQFGWKMIQRTSGGWDEILI